jgi:hypothetical protein
MGYSCRESEAYGAGAHRIRRGGAGRLSRLGKKIGNKIRWPGALVLVVLLASGCGEGKVPVTNNSYEPRIVIEGFLSPGQDVGGDNGILLTRNIRFDADLNQLDLLIRDAEARLIDVASGQTYPLVFDETNSQYGYEGDDLEIGYGQTYTLEVRASVDGTELEARATTTVPVEGFRIVEVAPDLTMPYRPLDADGEPVNFKLTIDRSPGTRYYLTTIRPRTFGSDNFVYDNPFADLDPEDVEDDIDDFYYSWDWIQNTPREAGQSTIELFWFFLWFYTDYDIVVYAADSNYSSFLQTFDEVQEEDGNFHEPVFSIEGEGIGVFGSYIKDQVRISVTQAQ